MTINSLQMKLKNHAEQYKAIALSTGHLTEEDVMTLTNMVHRTNMVTMRDTGWFVKLYEIENKDASDIEAWREYYPFVSDSLMTILQCVYLSGFRMIEFDSDAEEIEA